MTRTRWFGLGVVVVLVLAAAGWAAIEFGEGRDDIPRDAVLGEGSPFEAYLPNARDTTSSTCADIACRWAVTSDTADLLMFRSQSDAQRFVDSSAEDARRSGWIAVVFAPDALTPQRRDELVAGLDGLYTSD